MKHIKLYEDFMTEKEFSDERRKELSSKGFALPDGSFPIETIADLKNAIHAYGRSKNQSQAAKHIAKRAKALGQEELIPTSDDFQKSLTESKDMKRWGNELWNRADEFKRKKMIQSRLGVEQPTEDLVKLPWSELPQEIRKEVIEIKEMASTDVHYKNIMAHYDKATASGKHQIEIVVTGKKSNRAKVEEELLDTTYEDILEFEEELGILDKY